MELTEADFTDKDYIKYVVEEWIKSDTRETMLTGEKYFRGEHDILDKKRTGVGEDGEIVEIRYLPNNKIVENMYKQLVEQKAAFLLSNDFSVSSEDEAYAGALNDVFSPGFRRSLLAVGEDAISSGVSYAYPFISDEGEFTIIRIPGSEGIPLYKDDTRETMKAFVRYFKTRKWNPSKKQEEELEIVEVYSPAGKQTYNKSDGMADLGSEPAATVTLNDGTTLTYEWNGLVPVLAFRSDSHETPLISIAKCHQDSINKTLSDWRDELEISPFSSPLCVTGASGTDPAMFRKNFSIFGVTFLPENCDMKSVSTPKDYASFKEHLTDLRERMIKVCQGYDFSNVQGRAPNEMNLVSIYSDISLAAQRMGKEFNKSLVGLKPFIDAYLSLTGKGDFSEKEFTIDFNMDTITVESNVVDTLNKSAGILSRETLVRLHPYVKDPEKEMALIESEEAAELEKAQAAYDETFDNANDRTQNEE